MKKKKKINQTNQTFSPLWGFITMTHEQFLRVYHRRSDVADLKFVMKY